MKKNHKKAESSTKQVTVKIQTKANGRAPRGNVAIDWPITNECVVFRKMTSERQLKFPEKHKSGRSVFKFAVITENWTQLTRVWGSTSSPPSTLRYKSRTTSLNGYCSFSSTDWSSTYIMRDYFLTLFGKILTIGYRLRLIWLGNLTPIGQWKAKLKLDDWIRDFNSILRG